jgi:hypothetical protein
VEVLTRYARYAIIFAESEVITLPNILIVGFGGEACTVRGEVEVVLHDLGVAEDAITTIVQAETQFCESKDSAPYLVVRNTDGSKAEAMARELNKRLNHDVEVEKIDWFFPKAPLVVAET